MTKQEIIEVEMAGALLPDKGGGDEIQLSD
jgi:hypothetical protein